MSIPRRQGRKRESQKKKKEPSRGPQLRKKEKKRENHIRSELGEERGLEKKGGGGARAQRQHWKGGRKHRYIDITKIATSGRRREETIFLRGKKKKKKEKTGPFPLAGGGRREERIE